MLGRKSGVGVGLLFHTALPRHFTRPGVESVEFFASHAAFQPARRPPVHPSSLHSSACESRHVRMRARMHAYFLKESDTLKRQPLMTSSSCSRIHVTLCTECMPHAPYNLYRHVLQAMEVHVACYLCISQLQHRAFTNHVLLYMSGRKDLSKWQVQLAICDR